MQTFQIEVDDNILKDLELNSIEEVQKRVYEAEKRVANGEFYTTLEYEQLMDKFFEEELGIKR